jgi:hypothetical protein
MTLLFTRSVQVLPQATTGIIAQLAISEEFVKQKRVNTSEDMR